jgi:hypothetical protein
MNENEALQGNRNDSVSMHLFLKYEFLVYGYGNEGKAITVTGCGGSQGCKALKLQYFSKQPDYRWW